MKKVVVNFPRRPGRDYTYYVANKAKVGEQVAVEHKRLATIVEEGSGGWRRKTAKATLIRRTPKPR